MVEKILGIDPGRGQEDLKSWTLKIFFEYLWTFYKCVCVRESHLRISQYYEIVWVCVMTWLEKVLNIKL
jgi:hypothetical protein